MRQQTFPMWYRATTTIGLAMFIASTPSCGGELGAEPEGVTERDEARTVAQTVTVPTGFAVLRSWPGVTVWRKNYAGGAPDYVTAVDLRSGTVRSIAGTVSGDTVGRKWLAPTQSSNNFWTDAARNPPSGMRPRVMVNGAFFSTNNTPTTIAFGLRMNGATVSLGYGLNEFPGKTLALAFDPLNSRASIVTHSSSVFSSNPDVVGALAPTADKGINAWLRRTFVGVRDDNNDGTIETLLTFSSTYASQPAANTVLTNFGATAVAMLDGGGSTGLVIDGTTYIAPQRTVPHALVIYSR